MSFSRSSVTFCLVASGVWAAFAAVTTMSFGACSGGSGTSTPVPVDFSAIPVTPLTSTEVTLIIRRAAAAIAASGSNQVHVAVVDRTGDLLGAWTSVTPTVIANGQNDGDNLAVGIARTTAFFSNSQAPLSSRTVETLATFHFPPTFSTTALDTSVDPSQLTASAGAGSFPNTVLAQRRQTTGVRGTPQGPLWQIGATNRGANIASASTTPATAFNAGAVFNPSRNINNPLNPTTASFPSSGIVPVPGGIPLFKAGRLVGGVGVFIGTNAAPAAPQFEAAEFAAITGATGTGAAGDENFFFSIPTEGAITIGGVLLPYVKQTTRPATFSAGTQPPAPTVVLTNGWLRIPVAGRVDPFGFLIGPRAAQTGSESAFSLSLADVNAIINAVTASADRTRAQIRLPLGSPAKVIATIVDRRGLILAHFRMEDTLCDAVDVVPAKARSVVYFCRPGGPAAADQGTDFGDGNGRALASLFNIATFPKGIALTTRTLGFLSQPFFPPGIDENNSTTSQLFGEGPLFRLARTNQLPAQADRWGSAPADPGYQNGLTFFPGSVPLYKGGELVGALGVSGDGVEQNDLIAFDGGRAISDLGTTFEPPAAIRCDNFTYQSVRLPYLKFPQTPR